MNTTETKLFKALIVEDDLTMQLIIKKSIEKNFNVLSFANGMQALSYLQKGDIPDIIIVDLNTPGMGGLGLITQLKASGFFVGIPILVLSGEESTETRIKCLDAGVDDYVVKPFNPRELEARLRAILRRVGHYS
jgi:DNA-binding response OmpR family regulator